MAMAISCCNNDVADNSLLPCEAALAPVMRGVRDSTGFFKAWCTRPCSGQPVLGEAGSMLLGTADKANKWMWCWLVQESKSDVDGELEVHEDDDLHSSCKTPGVDIGGPLWRASVP